jgi:hypothetical protein
MSVSLASIFEVVPEDMIAWKPEMAEQAIVIKQNGKTAPAKTGPDPSMNFVIAGICRVGQITRMATAKKPTAPIFRNELK